MRAAPALGCYALVASLALRAGPARADDAALGADDARAQAAVHFDRGLRYLDEGALESALVEFERADELVPAPRAAYNVALAYARLRKPVEAAQVLSACQSRHPNMTPDLAREIVSLLADQTARIGHLRVLIAVTGGTPVPPVKLALDGVELASFQPGQVIAIAAGFTLISASAPGMLSTSKRVSLNGGEEQQIQLELVPALPAFGTITVRAKLPGVELWLDGRAVGHTPLPTALHVPPGRHQIEASRAGYKTRRTELTVAQGAVVSFDFEAEEDRAQAQRGRLRLRLSEPDAVLVLDGKLYGPYTRPLELVAGPHSLRVERSGHYSVERLVAIAPDRETGASIWLEPTSDTRSAREQAAASHRWLGWTSLGLGSAAVLVSGALLVDTLESLGDAGRKIRAFNATTQPGGRCDVNGDILACRAERDSLSATESRLTTERSLEGAGVALGAAVGALGAVLLLTGPDGNHYRRERFDVSLDVRTTAAFATALRGVWRF